MKACAKCDGPIPSPVLGDDPGERCPLCGDELASRAELAELLRLALHGGVVAIHRHLEGQEHGWRREAYEALDRALDEIDGAVRTFESDDYGTCRWCGVEIEATGSGEDWQDEDGSTTCGSHMEGCSACEDGEEHPHEPIDEACECTGGVLVGQTYGRTSPPWSEAVLVQRCDLCETFAGDLDAAVAHAAAHGGRVHVIGDRETEMLAAQSDAWVMPGDNPGPVIWHPTVDAVRAGWYEPEVDE